MGEKRPYNQYVFGLSVDAIVIVGRLGLGLGLGIQAKSSIVI